MHNHILCGDVYMLELGIVCAVKSCVWDENMGAATKIGTNSWGSVRWRAIDGNQKNTTLSMHAIVMTPPTDCGHDATATGKDEHGPNRQRRCNCG